MIVTQSLREILRHLVNFLLKIKRNSSNCSGLLATPPSYNIFIMKIKNIYIYTESTIINRLSRVLPKDSLTQFEIVDSGRILCAHQMILIN